MAIKAKRRARGTGPTLIQRSRSVSPAEKAAFHQIAGAGKRHVRREFFGLTPSDEAAIVERVQHGVRREFFGLTPSDEAAIVERVQHALEQELR